MAIYTYDGKILTEGNAIAIHEDCCCPAGTNEQWKKCSDDSNAAILSRLHTDVDYAWLCLGGIWVKCYNDSLTATVATDPEVLEQCDNDSPTSCDDLIGWPLADDWGGVDCNTGAVNDQNWKIRWSELTAQGKYTLAVSAANFTIKGDSDAGQLCLAYPGILAGITGDFDIQVAISGVVIPSFTNQLNTGILKMTIGGTVYAAGVYQSTGLAGNEGEYLVDGGNEYFNGTAATSATARISRSGTTLTIKSGAFSRNYTENGSVTLVGLEAVTYDAGGGNPYNNTVTFDSLVNNGSEIRIDPSGRSCP